MTRTHIGRGTLVATVVLALGTGGLAEGQPPRDTENHPFQTPTVLGDTGLWFVPTAEVLPSGQWALSTFRVNTDRQQGFTDISHFAGSGSVGIKNRVGLFGSLNAVTRIDRDLRPLNIGDMPSAGGLDSEFPFVREGFSEGFGDLSVGAKLNLLSESRGHPTAFAVRGVVKLPTGETDKGVSTGETDVAFDAVASKNFGVIEVSGLGGIVLRGDAPEVDLPDGIRWGFGAGFAAPARLRVVTEIRGEAFLEDEVVAARPIVSQDGSLSPLRSLVRNPVDALLGVTWQAPNGVFIGTGVTWAARFSARDRFGIPSAVVSEAGDQFGFQMSVGFRPSRRTVPTSLPSAPSPQPAPAPSAAARTSPEPLSVVDPEPVAFVFEDIHFDFDRYSLRPAALRVLDEVIEALAASPTTRLTIDGHTCNIGTAEYNLALADRRASAVREYLVGRGVGPERLAMLAYGEEQPGHDNSREETRRLNRRAALVVELAAAAQN